MRILRALACGLLPCLGAPLPALAVSPTAQVEPDLDAELERLRAALEAAREAVAAEGATSEAARAEVRAVADALPPPAELGAAWEEPLEALARLADELALPECMRPLQERVVVLKERRLGAEHEEVLRAKRALAVALKTTGDLAGALAVEEELYAISGRLLPAEDPELLRIESNLGVTRARLGDVEGALALFERVHEVRARTLPADDPELLSAKLNLAVTRKSSGDLAGALELEEQVHAARERLLSADDPALMRIKLNLGSTRHRLGDLEGALALFEEVRATYARILPAGHPARLQAAMNLAATRSALGDFAGALPLEEAVHAAYARGLPADHPELLRVKGNLAATRKHLGDLEGALGLFEQVLAAFERTLPAEHPSLLRTKHNLAALRDELGDHVGATALFEEVHEVFERTLPADSVEFLRVKQNLAVSCKALGQLDRSLALLEHVVAARRRLFPPGHPDRDASENNLAVTLRQRGDPEGALALLEQVAAARRERLPADHPDVVRVELNLGSLREDLGDLEGARELLERVLAVRERRLPPDHPDLLLARANLGGVLKALGERERTLAVTRALLEGQLARASGLGVESHRVARAAALEELERLSKALHCAEAAEHPGERLDGLLFAVLESLRLVSTRSAALALELARHPELAVLRDRLADLRGELHDLSLAAPADGAALDAWNGRLHDLAERRDVLERELRTRLAERGTPWETPTAEAVARGLGDGSALVSFFRTTRHADPDADGRRPAPVESLLAFVVTPDAVVRRVELGPAAELEDLAARWRVALGEPAAGRGVGVASSAPGALEEEALGRELRRRLLGPCLARLDARPARVHVILDDFLHLVPLGALPTDGTGRLGETLRVHVETSVGRLVAPPRPASGAGTLVALGGVDFDAPVDGGPAVAAALATPPVRVEPGTRAGLPGSLAPLPGTRAEVEALGELYEGFRAEEPELLLGRDATKAALGERASEARWLHVATHGWFAPRTLASMRDELEAEGELAALTRAEGFVRGFAPETLCGLALAGANRGKDALGKVPGILTAEELATLDLAGCELAVLSACETNVGLRRAGQGIQSLQGALHAAGARTAITSLWKVDDAATRRLMELLYTRLWTEGLGKAEALWQAKMTLRSEGHPLRDWAGWVLTGDPD